MNRLAHTNPRLKPMAPNSQSGSEPDAPIDVPKTGIAKVKNAMAKNFLTEECVISAIAIAMIGGVIQAIPSSQKFNMRSGVNASTTKLNDNPVLRPIKPPNIQSLITGYRSFALPLGR